jgi:hypothetical protein
MLALATAWAAGTFWLAPPLFAQEEAPPTGIHQALFDVQASNELFGDRIAFHGNTLAVSAPRTAETRGAVLIYTRSTDASNLWTIARQILEPSAPGNSAYAGQIAVFDDLLAVAYNEQVLIYRRDMGGANQWGLQAQISPPAGVDKTGYGTSLFLAEGLLLVGSPFEVGTDGGGRTTHGALYLYQPDATDAARWNLQQRLAPAPSAAPGFFSAAATQSGDWIAASAPAETSNQGQAKGVVYLFRRQSGETWTQARVVPIDDVSSIYDQLSLQGDSLVVAKPSATVDMVNNAGAVTVLMRNQGGADNWGLATRITDPTPAQDTYFGMAVAISGNSLLVSRLRSSPTDASSALGVFIRESPVATDWTLLRAHIVQGLTGYGRQIVVDGSTVMVNAPWHNLHGEANRGMVFSYRRDIGGAGMWGLAATIVGPGCIEDCGTDYYALAATDLVNLERTKAGCAQVRVNPLLDQSALSHSVDQATRDYYSHDTPEGDTFGDRIFDAGYRFSIAAEILFKGPTSPEQAVRGWMDSPVHRDIILNCELTETGFGVWSHPNSGNELFWTQVFGKPTAEFLIEPPPGITPPPLDGHLPYSITLSSQEFLEGLPVHALVGTLAALDLDIPDDSHTFALIESDANPDNLAFVIQGDELRNAEVLYHANQPKYRIRVQTTDAEGHRYATHVEIFVTKVAAMDYLPVVARSE